MEKRLVNQLERQLVFLENSCRLFDLGFREEGIRIALVIRVLVHQTKNSSSLLGQMQCRNIAFLDTCKEMTPGADGVFLGLVNKALGQPYGHLLVPIYGTEKVSRKKAIKDWWGQVVAMEQGLGTSWTREAIVLSAANKDGGAHVDELPEEYVDLSSPGFVERVTDQGVEFQDAGLVSLRQMAYELLNSEELIRLAIAADAANRVQAPFVDEEDARRMKLPKEP